MSDEEKTKDAEVSGSNAEKTEEKVEEAAEVAEEKSKEAPNAEVAEEPKEEEVKVEEEKQEEKAPEASEAPEAVEAKEAPEEKPAPSGKFKDLIKEIENLSVLELSELVKTLEERFGVSAAAPVAMATASGGAQTESVEEEEKTSYDVILASSGDKKIQVIKAVREIKQDLGLKEAKDLVDGAPKELLKGAKKEDAEAAKTKLEAAGATVELK
jgi:large subunit ribosomal protein L7/L12